MSECDKTQHKLYLECDKTQHKLYLGTNMTSPSLCMTVIDFEAFANFGNCCMSFMSSDVMS